MISCIFKEGNTYKNLCNGQWIESENKERIKIYSLLMIH